MKVDSLASKAFLEIRRIILSSQLSPHTRLKEDEWAKKLGVSRMAVREALTRLLDTLELAQHALSEAATTPSIWCES